mgnify:CR=1 FL=1
MRNSPAAFGRTSAILPLAAITALSTGCRTLPTATRPTAQGPLVAQADGVLTVAEGKRLIAKAVARMPLVQQALERGMVIVCKGTTNTYVAEELLGRRIAPGAFVIGRVTPRKGAASMPAVDSMPEVVLIRGQHRPEITLDEALRRLAPGDVVIKGGNALDYANRIVGVWTGSPTGGTAGKILPLITARKAHLVIPIGLEKLVATSPTETAARTVEPVTPVTPVPRMRILAGEIVTEIEALRILANVAAFQASAGGIGGAEGAVWLVWRGKREDVERARALVEAIQGEKPFVR